MEWKETSPNSYPSKDIYTRYLNTSRVDRWFPLSFFIVPYLNNKQKQE